MRKYLRLALLCQMFLFTLTAPTTLGQTGNATAHWRFAHFAAGVSPLDIVLNAQATNLQSVEFGSVTEWQPLSAGSYDFGVNSAETITLFSLNLVLGAGEWVTIAATGSEEEVTGAVIHEDRSPEVNDNARLTVFNALSGNAPVDIRANSSPIAQELQVGTQAAVELQGAIYNIEVAASNDADSILINDQAVELQAGSSYLVAAVNSLDDPRLIVIGTALEETPASDKSLLRIAHLSSGTPPLDVYIDGELGIFEGLSFPEFGRWIALPSGDISVTITLEDESPTSPVIPPFNLAIAPHSYTTIAVIGALENNTLEARVLTEDYSPLAPGFVRVNVLNAHPGIGPVDIETEEGTSFIQRLGYPGFFGGNNGFNQFVVETGTYDLRVSQSQTGDTVFELPGTNLFEGRNYFISVISANPPFILTFSDLNETQALLGN